MRYSTGAMANNPFLACSSAQCRLYTEVMNVSATKFWCDSITPLGSPVVPLDHRMRIRLSLSAWRSMILAHGSRDPDMASICPATLCRLREVESKTNTLRDGRSHWAAALVATSMCSLPQMTKFDFASLIWRDSSATAQWVIITVSPLILRFPGDAIEVGKKPTSYL